MVRMLMNVHSHPPQAVEPQAPGAVNVRNTKKNPKPSCNSSFLLLFRDSHPRHTKLKHPGSLFLICIGRQQQGHATLYPYPTVPFPS